MNIRRVIAVLIAAFAVFGSAAPAFASHGADDPCGAGTVCDAPGHH